MAAIHNVTLNAQTYGYGYKKNEHTSVNNYIIEENNKVSNDYFWKSNEATEEDGFGRALDLTTLINKPNGYLKGSLSDTDDVDYYKFNIAEYRILSIASDKYNVDIQITLDHIPEGCDYDLILYDKDGNQIGIGVDNGNGGKSITIPSWMQNRVYTVKVQAKDGSDVSPDECYHLSFQTTQADKNNVLSKLRKEAQEYAGSLRQKLHDGQDVTEETQALQKIQEKYEAYYAKQLEKLHKEQAKEYLQGEEFPDSSEISKLLERLAAGEELTKQEKELINIFATAQESDSAKAGAKLNTTLKDEIISRMQREGIDITEYSFDVQIGADGKVHVEGIDDESIKTKVEAIFAEFSDKLMDIYITLDSDIQNMSEQEKYLLKAAIDLEKFLNKATNGSISLDDLTVENGRIKGLPANLDSILNEPGDNLTYLNYRGDILLLINYERTQNKKILSELNVEFSIKNGKIQTKGKRLISGWISSTTDYLYNC